MKITVSRIYDDLETDDSFRVLVDGLWPRGIRKESASLDLWARELAPSTKLRKWFHEHPEKWDEFQQRYRSELDSRAKEFAPLLEEIGKHNRIKLLYSSRNQLRNNAIALKDWLEEKLTQ